MQKRRFAAGSYQQSLAIVRHNNRDNVYYDGGNLKKAKFHSETVAMAGHEEARFNLSCIESNSGNIEHALKHLRIAASAGCFVPCMNLDVYLNKVLSVESQSNQV